MDSPAKWNPSSWFGFGGFGSKPVQEAKPYWLTDRVLGSHYGADARGAAPARPSAFAAQTI